MSHHDLWGDFAKDFKNSSRRDLTERIGRFAVDNAVNAAVQYATQSGIAGQAAGNVISTRIGSETAHAIGSEVAAAGATLAVCVASVTFPVWGPLWLLKEGLSKR